MPSHLNKDKPTGSALFDIALGSYANATVVHKFGANFNIDLATDPETVWTGGGMYPWAAFDTAQTIYCLSTDAGDTDTLQIEGLDENYNLLTEEIQLTGTVAVTTINTFKRVFTMSYLVSTGDNAGVLTARTVSGVGTVVAQIDIGRNRTLMAIYTIPAGHTGLLIYGDLTIGAKKNAELGFYIRQFGGTFLLNHLAEVTGLYARSFPAPLTLPAKSDLDTVITSVDANGTTVTANFDLILIKD